ncbi:MAG: AbrB/MazE/SpoVT family DNA-binding domain-containing protein [Chloroflexota bacterium]
MEAILNSKGQILIPVKIRRQLGIRDGTYLQIDVNTTKQIVLTPITHKYVHSLRGKYKGKRLMKALIAEKKRERDVVV